ncbi:hypothetical protein B0T25DRAFT_137765 [Lasiosphaeria hispida]|uniref:Uncharacterized protein n=1 Tax=Lasiosphaeria hispida TaxID=260671 RepID=A0AAJ0HKU0_9PEZI|nr:hypothetical protein B0T25DRAFT_137765 [Lasiosphaeria hispida]
MDWPDVQRPVLKISATDKSFIYGDETNFTSQVLRDISSPAPHNYQLKSPHLLKEDDDWEPYLELFSEETGCLDQSGYHVLLSARVVPEQLEPEIAAELNCLPEPFSLPRWQQVTKNFRLHNVICKALRRGKSYSAYLVDDSDSRHGTVEMYTAVMSSEWLNNIAISSTHFKSSNLTLAVIYGCDGEQMERIKQLLAASPEVRGHPLLMVGVFAELQRDRLEDLVLETEKQLDTLFSQLGVNKPDIPKHSLTWDLSRQLRSVRLRAKKVEEEAKTTKGELSKMITRIREASEETSSPKDLDRPSVKSFATSAERFTDRFLEICNELESMMVRCRIGLDEATFARELFMAELSRQEAKYARNEAENTSRQARTGTVIAFVAMCYLPTTSVATIFAMPVFDFKNRWWNERFRDGSSNSNTNPDTPDLSLMNPPPPVLSGYFWIYLIISALLTVGTLYSWYIYTQPKPQPNDGLAGGSGSIRSSSEPSIASSWTLKNWKAYKRGGSGSFSWGFPLSDSEAREPNFPKRWSLDPRYWFGGRERGGNGDTELGLEVIGSEPVLEERKRD